MSLNLQQLRQMANQPSGGCIQEAILEIERLWPALDRRYQELIEMTEERDKWRLRAQAQEIRVKVLEQLQAESDRRHQIEIEQFTLKEKWLRQGLEEIAGLSESGAAYIARQVLKCR